MPRRIWPLAGLLLGLVFPVFPAAARAEQPFRLLSPVTGESWEPGELARIEWATEGAIDGDLSEWEAFLSLDGGKTYPIRLTPHLDLALRGFSFEVPDVPSRDARLLLRFGDEQTERIFEAPIRFEIGMGSGQPLAADLLSEPLARTLELGEPARAGDPGVVAWLEGDRKGRGLRAKVRIPMRTAFHQARSGTGRWLLTAGPERQRVRLAPPPRSDRPTVEPPVFVSVAPLAEELAPPVPLRLRIHRFNE